MMLEALHLDHFVYNTHVDLREKVVQVVVECERVIFVDESQHRSSSGLVLTTTTSRATETRARSIEEDKKYVEQPRGHRKQQTNEMNYEMIKL